MNATTPTLTWAVATTDLTAHQLEQFFHSLNAPERQAAQEQQHPLDKKSRIAAHGLKRLALAHITGADAAALNFQTAPLGKPRVISPHALFFNVTHTRRLVACVTSPQPCGIDTAPPCNPIPNTLTPFEHEQIKNLSFDKKATQFAIIWSIKESVLKAEGIGLHHPPHSIETKWTPGTIEQQIAGPHNRWAVTLRIVAGQPLAVAMVPAVATGFTMGDPTILFK